MKYEVNGLLYLIGSTFESLRNQQTPSFSSSHEETTSFGIALENLLVRFSSFEMLPQSCRV